MFTILASNPGWNVLHSLVDTIVPVSVVVVLPIMIVWLVMRTRQHAVNKKTEIMLKAIENGAQLDPNFLKEAGPRQKSAKDKLIGNLTTALVTGILGIIILVVELVFFFTIDGIWTDEPGISLLLLIVPAVLIALGLAFFFIYLIRKRMYSKELAKPE